MTGTLTQQIVRVLRAFHAASFRFHRNEAPDEGDRFPRRRLPHEMTQEAENGHHP